MKLFYSIAALLSVLLYSCGKVEDPQFKGIDNLKVKKLGLQETTIGFDVTFYNPNGFGVNVKEAVCDVYMDSVYVGKFSQDTPINVPQRANFSLPLTGVIPLQTALQLNVSKLTSQDVLFKANGSVKVGKAGVYITRPVNYEGRHRIDIK